MSRLFWWLMCSVVLTACGGGDVQQEEELGMPDLVVQVQQQSRLYSTECRVRKIIAHNDTRQLSGSILRQEFSVDLPLGRRRVAIPVEATVRAYIDFADFGEDNVHRSGDQIEIVLPDPKIELIGTRAAQAELFRRRAVGTGA